MCGRFSVGVTTEEMVDYLYDNYLIEETGEEMDVPRYNVAPGQNVLSVINDGKKNRAGHFRWGFVPAFSADEKSGYSMINAKAETLPDKPSFRSSLKNKRCVILADGFYEWGGEGKHRIPMRFQLKDRPIFPMAGLWGTFTRPDGTKLHSCTIITTTANAAVSPTHDRMPVILTEENRKQWLDPNISDFVFLASLLRPYEAEKMLGYEVSPLINKAENDSPECILKI
jgi:putative SOS response-associated peptidase YedK